MGISLDDEPAIAVSGDRYWQANAEFAVEFARLQFAFLLANLRRVGQAGVVQRHGEFLFHHFVKGIEHQEHSLLLVGRTNVQVVVEFAAVGTAQVDEIDKKDEVDVSQLVKEEEVNDDINLISRKYLAEIINARVEETFQLVKKELVQAGCHLDSLSSGIVLTGGTAMLSGICQVAQQVFGAPVRVGSPKGVSELGDVHHPMYAGAVGLTYFTAREHGTSIRSTGKSAAAAASA